MPKYGEEFTIDQQIAIDVEFKIPTKVQFIIIRLFDGTVHIASRFGPYLPNGSSYYKKAWILGHPNNEQEVKPLKTTDIQQILEIFEKESSAIACYQSNYVTSADFPRLTAHALG